MSSRRNRLHRFMPVKMGNDALDVPITVPQRRSSDSYGELLDGAVDPLVTRSSSDKSLSSSLSSDDGVIWLRRADQFLLGTLLIALLVLLLAFRWKLSGGGRGEIEIVSQQPREYFYAIEINKASWVEWAQLDGIGEKLGRRIVSEREEHGGFDSIDDLRRVRGIGPKLIEKLRPFLKCARVDRLEHGERSER